jgi:hypothetical protein
MTLEQFEQMPNAAKRDHIAKFPIEDLFMPELDTDFRNGIGHHAAHYEQEHDTIVIFDTKDAGTVSRVVGYTEFSEKVLDLPAIRVAACSDVRQNSAWGKFPPFHPNSRQPFPRGHNGRFARNPDTCSRLRGCGQLQGLPSFLHKKSQVGQPPIMPTLFESRKPKACRIEKQEYHNPDRIHRPQREPVVNRKKFARAAHRGRRNQQE